MTIVYTIPAVRDAWADTAIPTTDIVDPGNAFAAAGWLQSTTPPPRQYFNWALNWTANAVRYFMQNGIVDWQAGELYQIGSVVVFNGCAFQSIINNNTNQTPVIVVVGGVNTPSSSASWTGLTGYPTLASLASFVTAAQLAAALVPYAALNSPTLVGIPLAPTAGAGTSNNQIATTAFVQAALAANLTSYLTIANAAATYLTIATAAATYATQAALAVAISGFGAGKLPAGIYRNSLGSGNVIIQQGGVASGGSPGDITLIY